MVQENIKFNKFFFIKSIQKKKKKSSLNLERMLLKHTHLGTYQIYSEACWPAERMSEENGLKKTISLVNNELFNDTNTT